MQRALALALACAGILRSRAALADVVDEGTSGVEIAARLGYGVPFGNVQSHKSVGGSVGDPLDQTIEGMIPIAIDAGYRFGPRWFAGIFFAFAPGLLGDALDAQCNGVGCQLFDLRAGMDVQFHVSPARLWDPWFGVGAGYESLGVTFAGAGPSIWASGFELVNLQAGLDARLDAFHAIGPFVTLTTAEYVWKDPLPSSSGFAETSLHEWLIFGVRAVFDFATQGPVRQESNGAR
jgi:hypothetical protein